MRTPSEPPADLRELYLACYGRLVASLVVVGGRREDAEEAAQEAFIRLIPRWERVSQYDDPEAWLRLVAYRVLTKRWRRWVRKRSLLLSEPQARVTDVDAAIDVTQAVARLPPEQRDVVFLHYLCDTSVENCARQLDLPVGTVKSRLSRARSALATMLDEEAHRNA